MDIMEFREYCLSLPLTEETTPFDEDTLVYKIAGKMYTFTSISDYSYITVKCEPARLLEFTEKYECINPAFHMNKVHWMSILTDGGVSDSFTRERIRESYRLVISGMTRSKRSEIMEAVAACGLKL